MFPKVKQHKQFLVDITHISKTKSARRKDIIKQRFNINKFVKTYTLILST